MTNDYASVNTKLGNPCTFLTSHVMMLTYEGDYNLYVSLENDMLKEFTSFICLENEL